MYLTSEFYLELHICTILLYLKVLMYLVILNASCREFQILGAKKQKEFAPCRTLFMRGIFRIFSEFLNLRVRHHFTISSRR